MNKYFQNIMAVIITAAIVGVYTKLNTLEDSQSKLMERLVRIETIVMPPPHVNFSSK